MEYKSSLEEGTRFSLLEIYSPKAKIDSPEYQLARMLPQLSEEEKQFIAKLPSTYILKDVPFFLQEEKHWSGAAVVQMLVKYLGRETDSQEKIIKEADWADFHTFDHSTFREKISRYFLGKGFLYSQYYPAGYIAPAIGDGIRATDFIRANSKLIAETDFAFFQALLVSRKKPLIARLHFTHLQYPMSAEMIQRVDVSGHCVLIVGYNEEGFIIHDPWNKKKWGGTGGGAYTLQSYDILILERQFVDASYDYVGAIDDLEGCIPIAKEAVYEGKNISLEVVVKWPGITGILGSWYHMQDISVELEAEKPMKVLGKAKRSVAEALLPGKEIKLKWQISVGDKEGSYGVSARIKGNIHSPLIPWEEHSEKITGKIISTAVNRICVFKKEFLQKFGQIQ